MVLRELSKRYIVPHTLKHLKNNNDKNLISINVLEFVTIIYNNYTALTGLTTGNIINYPHTVVLHTVETISVHLWTVSTRKISILRMIIAIFCHLLMDYVLGINSIWISMCDNCTANHISRLKQSS